MSKILRAVLATFLIVPQTALAESGAAFSAQYRIDQNLQKLEAARAEEQEVIDAVQDQFSRERAEYEARLKIIDLNYKIDDPMCRPIRDAEKEIQRKLRVEERTRRYQIEDRIKALCHSTNYDTYVDFVGKLVEAAKDTLLFNPQHFAAMGPRLEHKLLSREAAEVLNYDRLDQVLEQDCFQNDSLKDLKKNYFKIALVESDIAPSTIGTAGGLIAGWYAYKGLGKILWAPVQGLLKITKAGPTAHKVANGVSWMATTGLVATALVAQTAIKYEEFQRVSAETSAREELEDTMRGLDYESTFPDLYAKQALMECYDHIEMFQKKSSKDPTFQLWYQTANSNCENFIDRAALGLDRLENYDMARCHPGNKNAASTLKRQVQDLVTKWPRMKEYATEKGF